MGHRVSWHDSGKSPRVKPNPNYPKGIDLDLTDGKRIFCTVELPYPARRIGYYRIECDECKIRVACTTAGRPDDPRSVMIACKGRQGNGPRNTSANSN